MYWMPGGECYNIFEQLIIRNMKIQMSSEHIELFEHHKSYISEKLEALRKYSDILKYKEEAVMIRVMVENRKIKDDDHHILITVNMSVPHAMIRGEAAGKTIEEAADLVIEKLKRQLVRYKDKHMHDMHDGGGRTGEVPEEIVEAVEEAKSMMEMMARDSRVTRRKLFTELFPMSETDAINQMEELGHTFFIFVNGRTDRYNLVYKRDGHDGYGLVELEHPEGVLGD